MGSLEADPRVIGGLGEGEGRAGRGGLLSRTAGGREKEGKRE